MVASKGCLVLVPTNPQWKSQRSECQPLTSKSFKADVVVVDETLSENFPGAPSLEYLDRGVSHAARRFIVYY
jgi:hypothetical protein